MSTSLVSITDDLKHFSQSNWVITAYLLTYTSFMIVLAKLSDVFGRKTMLLFSTFMFTVFSGGCAAAQTMVQLCAFRKFVRRSSLTLAQDYLQSLSGHRRQWRLFSCVSRLFRNGPPGEMANISNAHSITVRAVYDVGSHFRGFDKPPFYVDMGLSAEV